MDFDAVLIPPRRAAMVAQGFWHDRTINDDLDACVAACPDKLALSPLQVESGDGHALHLPRDGAHGGSHCGRTVAAGRGPQ